MHIMHAYSCAGLTLQIRARRILRTCVWRAVGGTVIFCGIDTVCKCRLLFDHERVYRIHDSASTCYAALGSQTSTTQVSQTRYFKQDYRSVGCVRGVGIQEWFKKIREK